MMAIFRVLGVLITVLIIFALVEKLKGGMKNNG